MGYEIPTKMEVGEGRSKTKTEAKKLRDKNWDKIDWGHDDKQGTKTKEPRKIQK